MNLETIVVVLRWFGTDFSRGRDSRHPAASGGETVVRHALLFLLSVIYISACLAPGLQPTPALPSEPKAAEPPGSTPAGPNACVRPDGGSPEQYTVLVPFYVYPSWWDPDQYLWDDLAQARRRVSIFAVINPHNGPGGPPNEDYRHGMQTLAEAGVVMLGYVPTGYGDRPSEAVRYDVNLYADHYAVQGIFFDEVPTDPVYLSRYQSYYTCARNFFLTGVVVFNFGTLPPQAYLDIGALNVVFEDQADRWWTAASQNVTLNPETTSVLVYSASLQDMRAILQDICTHNTARYVYFTDDEPPNPWDSLPSYWDELLEALAP